MRRLLFLSGALLLCACSDDAGELPANGNAAASEALDTPALTNNAEASRGAADPPAGATNRAGSQWFSKYDGGDSWSGYGPPFSEAAFSARCERKAGRLVFNTAEMPPSGPGRTEMLLSADGFEQSLPAEASEEGLPNTSAAVDADADWLSRLASLSGDLTVRVGGSDPLTVPIGEPLRSLIRDCAR